MSLERFSLTTLLGFIISILLSLLVLASGVLAAPPSIAATGNYDCKVQSAIPQSECEALVAIYNATDGPNWIQPDWLTAWLTDPNPCNWNGVICENGRVNKLLFYPNHFSMGSYPTNLSGSLPPQIGQLSELTELSLGINNITSIPAEIGQLERLTYLDFYGNNLTTVPSEIGNLPNLTALNLAHNELSTIPSEIGNLSNLKSLGLSDNSLTSLPDDIVQLSNLKSLGLSGNQLVSLPSEFGQLTSLEVLDLYENKLTVLPAGFGQLVNMRNLILSGNELTELPADIGQLIQLEELFLHGNQLTILPAGIGQFSKLWWLEVQGNKLITLPPEIGQLSNLQKLYLQENELTSLPKEIGQLSKLYILDLWGNKLTAVPTEIGNLSVERLQLSNNQLTTLPSGIGNLKVEILNLSSNKITELPPEIGALSGPNGLIHELDLSSNQLTTLPSEIGNMSVAWLDLSNNQLTALPEEFGQVSDLFSVRLNDNPLLSGAIPDFSTTTSLRTLIFYGTNLCVPSMAEETWLNELDEVIGTGYICGEPFGGLSGRITINDPNNKYTAPITSTSVVLYQIVNDVVYAHPIRTTSIDEQGRYLFDDLGQGVSYIVEVVPPLIGFQPQYYGSQYSLQEATPVTTTLGITTTDIDVTYEAPQAILFMPLGLR